MKKVTKLFVLAIALFSLNVAMAQKTETTKVKPKVARPAKLTTEQKATRNADSLKARINLTDAQYAKVVPINVEYFNGRDALRVKAKSDTTAMATFKSDVKALHATRKKQIAAILTPEQKKAWATWKKAHTANIKKGNKVKSDDDDIDASEE